MRLALAAALALAPAFAPTAGQAQQQQCAARDVVLQALAERFGESRRAIGLTAQGQLVETFANDDTGSWTITVAFPDGRMCLVASGSGYQAFAAEPLPAGDPA